MRTFTSLLIIAYILLSNITFAQLNESFTDGDFTANPAWSGDTDMFEVIEPPTSGDGSIDEIWNADANLLRSKPNLGDAALTTASDRAYGEWLFSISDGRGWSVSGSNDFYVILMSDTNDPALLKDGSKDFNGYFLRFDGGTDDNFVLYKQSGTTSTALINTNYPDGNDGTTSMAYSIKVTRETSGEWNVFIEEGLYIDAAILLGSASDNEITTSSYFGVVTNIANPGEERLFYIDQIITRDLIEDNTPPVVTTFQVSSPKTLDVTYDEYTDSLSANTQSNYTLNQNINPDSVYYIDDLNSKVRLIFDNPLSGGTIAELRIFGVEDIEGNMLDTTINFMTPDILNSNIMESFTDLNISENPEWLGDTDKFEIIDPSNTTGNGSFNPAYETDGAMLRSKMNESNSAITFQTIRSFGQWSFTVADGDGWSISSNNDFYILLNASTNDPELLDPDNKNFTGYYLHYDGGSDDSFVLYKQSGTESTPIIETNFPEETDGSTSIPYTIKITRTEAEGWRLFIDEGVLGSAYTLRGTATDNEITTGSYFGIATNIGSPAEERVVYIDNIYAGEIINDTIAPALESLNVNNASQLTLDFSEPVDSTIISTANFSTQNTGAPSQVDFQLFGKQIVLTFDNEFPLREDETITITGIEDLQGNAMNDTSLTFTYFIPLEGDIVINEVFFDTYPQVALPEYDYFELFNRTSFNISLKNWTVEIGDDVRDFPDYELAASEYLIVTSSGGLEVYSLYGDAINVITTSSLTNTGEKIVIKDSTGTIIHQINYSQDWYHDPEKEDGGWSIEQIDPDTWCAMSNNWRASESGIGGTPGEINSVDDENPDNTAPFVTGLAVTDTSRITLELSEICPPEQINATNIQVNPNQGELTFTQNEENPRQWIISTTNDLPVRQAIDVSISNLTDFCGNTMTDTSITAYRIPASFQQVIFNEIMPEPAENDESSYEYLELFNRDSLPVSIQGWQLKAGSKTFDLPFASIPAKDFLLILPESIKETDTSENAIYLFDDSDLNDGGELLTLSDKNSETVSWVEYDDDWHDNSIAELGGYALERVDTEYLCGSKENWRTSTSENHGTPGKQNSVSGTTETAENPTALYYILPEDTSIHILFDTPLWPDTSSNYITASGFQIDSVSIPHPKGIELILNIKEPLEYFNPYSIRLQGFKDCNQREMEPAHFYFEKPTQAELGDVVINEVLFNPPTDCEDFVELLNISDKYIALDLMLTANLGDDDMPVDFEQVTEKRYVLPPDTPYIITSTYECLEEAYSPVFKKQTILTSLPSLPNDEGSLAITDIEGNFVDKMRYTEDMHHRLLDDPDGVSLERISPFAPSSNHSNWYSAASDAGFATPTRENSQYNATEIKEDNISLEHEAFSPDGDGYQDFLKINYKFSSGNNVMNVRILDRTGAVRKNLFDNETTSTEGFITWDGTDDDGQKLPMGIYIIYTEWYDENGNQHSDKKTCVIAGDLK